MISINTKELASNVKAVTSASDEAWGKTFRSVVNVIGIAVAFVIAIGVTAVAAYKHPMAALKAWTTPAPVAVSAPVKERPTKSVPRPRPVAPAVNVIAEKPMTASAPKRTPRARKKRTLATV